MNIIIEHPLSVATIAGVASLAYGAFLIWTILKKSRGEHEMVEIQKAIQEGAKAYLKRQNTTVAYVGIIVFALLWVWLGTLVAIGFAVGAIASAVAGYVGMMVSSESNSRVAQEAKHGMARAFDLAFKGGAVTGFFVVGLALLSVTLFYWYAKDVPALIGLGFGASLISVFARLGGGIFTKGADVGADLVGKVEAGIPEDDPRNPAVIADLTGDMVGDDAGMAADLFETYVVSLVSVMFLGNLLVTEAQWTKEFVELPLMIGSLAVGASIIGSLFVRLTDGIMAALYKGLAATSVLLAGGLYWLADTNPGINFITSQEGSPISTMDVFITFMVGIFVTAFMFVITDYYTSKKYKPVRSIADASTTGHGTNIIMGLAVSMKSTALPALVISVGMFIAYSFLGIYGVALATMTMLSLAAIIIAIDAFGPITDNAGGIAEMAGMPKEVREVTDALDAVGNTTKAVTKGYAIASAGLAALVLFAAYTFDFAQYQVQLLFVLSDPRIIIGLFIGGMMPYLFGAFSLEAVGKAGSAVVDEVRRQFREIPGIMEGKAKPDYGTAVDIVTRAALRQMIIPALIPIVIPVLVGIILGPEALGGLLVGVIVTGLFVAISMTSGGAAWDNAKKYIEEGHHGGKGGHAHKAAVTGDTVGDPYKDTAGPAINPMIKVANIVALLMVGFLSTWTPLVQKILEKMNNV